MTRTPSQILPSVSNKMKRLVLFKSYTIDKMRRHCKNPVEIQVQGGSLSSSQILKCFSPNNPEEELKGFLKHFHSMSARAKEKDISRQLSRLCPVSVDDESSEPVWVYKSLCREVANDRLPSSFSNRSVVVYKDSDGYATRAYVSQPIHRDTIKQFATSLRSVGMTYIGSTNEMNQLKLNQEMTGNDLFWHINPKNNGFANYANQDTWDRCLEFTVELTGSYSDPNWCSHFGLNPVPLSPWQEQRMRRWKDLRNMPQEEDIEEESSN